MRAKNSDGPKARNSQPEAWKITADDTEIRCVTSGTPEMQPILNDYNTMYEEIVRLSSSEVMGRLAARGYEALIQDGPWKPSEVEPVGSTKDDPGA